MIIENKFPCCEARTLKLDVSEVATEVRRRTCPKCGTLWQIKIRKTAEPVKGVAIWEWDWTDLDMVAGMQAYERASNARMRRYMGGTP